VAEVGAEIALAWVHDKDRRRRPRWLGSGNDTGSAWTTSGLRRFYRVSGRDMSGCSTVEGMEGRSSTAAARMARRRGNGGGRGRARGIYRVARHWVTAADDEDAVVVPGLDQRAYGGAPTSERRSVERARPVRRGQRAARGPGGLQGPRGVGTWGMRGLGRRAALGGALSGRRGRPACGRGAAVPWLHLFCQSPV
jgi:hypothetical protein